MKYFPFMAGSQGLITLVKKAQTHTALMTSPTKKHKIQDLLFFYCEMEDSPSLLRVSTAL